MRPGWKRFLSWRLCPPRGVKAPRCAAASGATPEVEVVMCDWDLITVSIYHDYSIGPSTRPICTTILAVPAWATVPCSGGERPSVRRRFRRTACLFAHGVFVCLFVSVVLSVCVCLSGFACLCGIVRLRLFMCLVLLCCLGLEFVWVGAFVEEIIWV